MADALYDSADYQAALLALLPRGRVWPKSLEAVQSNLAAGLAATFTRHDQRAQQLLEDSFPASTAELLPEWELSLGLPDPCAGQAPTVAQRQGQVVARLTDTGGQSAQRFIDLAAALGYTITITTFKVARTGAARAGGPCSGPGWAHAWRVNAILNELTPARAGAARAGEHLANWGSAVLECEIRARAPADSVLLFGYSSPGELDFSDPGESAWIGTL